MAPMLRFIWLLRKLSRRDETRALSRIYIGRPWIWCVGRGEIFAHSASSCCGLSRKLSLHLSLCLCPGHRSSATRPMPWIWCVGRGETFADSAPSCCGLSPSLSLSLWLCVFAPLQKLDSKNTSYRQVQGTATRQSFSNQQTNK